MYSRAHNCTNIINLYHIGKLISSGMVFPSIRIPYTLSFIHIESQYTETNKKS